MTSQQMSPRNISTSMLSPTADSSVGYERRVSSTILQEEFLEAVQQETIRYVEVPEYIEVPKIITKKSIVEVEKRVPKYEVEYVERVVEKPLVEYVDKVVEVPEVHEIVREIKKKETIQVPKEIIKHVPKIETRVVERTVEVPGQVIEVPKPYTVEKKIEVPFYEDTAKHVVVAQTVHPYIQDSSDDVVEVEVNDHSPEIIEVEVQVPKPVPAQIWSEGETHHHHRVLDDVPAAQFNSLLRILNPHLSTSEAEKVLPFVRDQTTGQVLAGNAETKFVALPSNTNVLSKDGVVYTAYDKTTTQALETITEVVSRAVSNMTKGTNVTKTTNQAFEVEEDIDEESTMSTESSSRVTRDKSRMTAKSGASQKSQKTHQSGTVYSKKSRGVSNVSGLTYTTLNSRNVTGMTKKSHLTQLSTTKKSRVCGC